MSASIAADRARANADARLVALARESRGEALELIYSSYKTRIYSFLLRLLADPVGADDLTQDVFTKAYQALGSLTTEHRVLPWLYRIATNTAIDHLRRKRRFTWLRVGRLAGTGEDPLMPDLHGAIPERDQVRRILSTLPVEQSTALLCTRLKAIRTRRSRRSKTAALRRSGAAWRGPEKPSGTSTRQRRPFTRLNQRWGWSMSQLRSSPPF